MNEIKSVDDLLGKDYVEKVLAAKETDLGTEEIFATCALITFGTGGVSPNFSP